MTSTLVTEAVHSDYPHIPGALYGCPACEVACNCAADPDRVPVQGDVCLYGADNRFSGHFDVKLGSWFVWDADNAKAVGDGKGNTLALGSQDSADDIAREMTERVKPIRYAETTAVTDMAELLAENAADSWETSFRPVDC